MLDPNPLPPGLHQYSVVVSTPFREMKFTAPSKERHDIWVNVLLFYFLILPSSQALNSYRPCNIYSPDQVLGHCRQRQTGQTVQLPDQASHNTALLPAMLSTLWKITRLNTLTLNYWPVPRALEAAAAFISAVTPGPVVAREVHHNYQLVAP